MVSRSQTPAAETNGSEKRRRREAKRNAKNTQLCCALDKLFGGVYVKIVKIVKKNEKLIKIGKFIKQKS